MKTFYFFIALVFALFNSFCSFSQSSFNDDFDTYDNGQNIKLLDRYALSDAIFITNEKARSGSNSLKMPRSGNSNNVIFDYEAINSDLVEISFYLWKDEGISIEISPEISIPFLRLKSNGYGVIYLDGNERILPYKNGQWNKIDIRINQNTRVLEFYINDDLIDLNIMNQIFRSRFAINNNQYGNVYIDDLEFKFSKLVKEEYNLYVGNLNIETLSFKGVSQKVGVNIGNGGFKEIDDFILNYKINGETYSKLIDTIIKPDESVKIELENLNFEEGENIVELSVSQDDGIENMLQDNFIKRKAIGKVKGNKRHLIEYVVSMKNGFSPAAYSEMNSLINKFGEDNINFVNLHRSDALSSNTYKIINITREPTVFINRKESEIFKSTDEYIKLLEEDSDIDLEMEVLYDKDNNSFNAVSKVIPKNGYNGVLYYNLIVVEDNFVGSSNLYDQNNYYSNGQFGYLKDFDALPEIIPYTDITYRYVGKSAVPSFYGKKENINISVNESITFNDKITLDFSTLSLNDYLILVVMDIDRNVLNSKKVNVKDVLKIISNTTSQDDSKPYIYPNPSSNFIALNNAFDIKSITISDVFGRILLTSNGNNNLVDIKALQNGKYHLTVTNQNGTFTLPFIKME